MKNSTPVNLPNFLIIGAARSGTTALYYYLQQHPDIGFPTLKEPKFFSSSHLEFPHNGPGDDKIDKYAIKSFDLYRELFNGLNNYLKIGEASPDYLYYHDLSAKSIRDELGDIPIIITLRNPVNRAFSAYSYLIRDSREYLSFREGLEAENERLSNNWDFIWAYKNAGMYYKQVKTFLENFSSVKIIVYEQFRRETEKTVSEIFEFLDIDKNVPVNTEIQHNKSGLPKNLFFKLLLSRNNKYSAIIREIMKKTIPRFMLEKVSHMGIKKIEMKPEDRDYLENFFLPENEKLFDLLGFKIEHWNHN